jgi:protein-L-isoaspartate(D-aspartate) O-methyltransferase
VPRGRELETCRDVSIPLAADGDATVSALHAYLVNYALLDLQAGDHLVEVGGGTGYGAALAARIVGPDGRVTTYEIQPELAAAAERNLRGRKNVTVRCTDGLASAALPEVNKVVFACAMRRLPDQYLDALPEHGRLVVPLSVDDGGGRQILTRFMRIDGELHVSEHGSVRYVRAAEAN